MDQAAAGILLVDIELDDAHGQMIDTITSLTKAARDSTNMYHDCRAGCVLKITSSTARYTVAAAD